jgi:2-methylisocitrate lyase-like PEP mutase family enzyme
MPSIKERRLKLRELIKPVNLVVAPSAFNALSARLIEETGFSAIHVSGSAINRFHAYADLGMLSITEMVFIHERIVEATSIPVIGDGESGFGGAIHTVRTVQAYERAGLAAMHIEDDPFPKEANRVQHDVIPTSEMVGKLKAALDSRTDDKFIIIARSNARESESFTQVMDRVCAYAETGADAIWPGIRIPDELAQLKNFVNLPLVGVPPRQEMTLETYKAYGFKIGCIPGILGQAATTAMAKMLETFKRTGADKEYWREEPASAHWRRWFSELGREEAEKTASLAKPESKK